MLCEAGENKILRCYLWPKWDPTRSRQNLSTKANVSSNKPPRTAELHRSGKLHGLIHSKSKYTNTPTSIPPKGKLPYFIPRAQRSEGNDPLELALGHPASPSNLKTLLAFSRRARCGRWDSHEKSAHHYPHCVSGGKS